jgi:prepilin-type N-terminal cleavage/methylation domain-containing protein
MGQAGYTMVEMLAALVMIGLAVSGLTIAAAQLGRLQGTARGDAIGAARESRLSTAFAGLLERAGPFRTDAASTFKGDADAFSFSCGDKTCGGEVVRAKDGLSLVLRRPSGLSETYALGKERSLAFEYEDEGGTQDSWPPSATPSPRTLHAIALVRQRLGEDTPLVEARIWTEQPADCAFDSISRSCRAEVAP